MNTVPLGAVFFVFIFAMSKSRVRVLEFSQSLTDRPMHMVSRKLAEALILDHNAVSRRHDLIQLTTRTCFAGIKQVAKKRLVGNPEVVIIAPMPGFEDGAGHGYGQWPTGSDQSSYSKFHFIETYTLKT